MIIDSSSLIILAKINRLDIIIKLYGNIEITKEIHYETVEKGLSINAPDAKIIKQFLDQNKINIIPLKDKYKTFSKHLQNIYIQLGSGEAEAITLSLQEKKPSLIMDEKLGRSVCKLHKLKPIGTLRILIEAYKRNLITEEETKSITNDLIRYKFRISADVISKFFDILEIVKIKRKKP